MPCFVRHTDPNPKIMMALKSKSHTSHLECLAFLLEKQLILFDSIIQQTYITVPAHQVSLHFFVLHTRSQKHKIKVTAWFIKILLDFTLSPTNANITRKVKWTNPPRRQSSRCALWSRSPCPFNAHLSLFTWGPQTYHWWTIGNNRRDTEIWQAACHGRKHPEWFFILSILHTCLFRASRAKVG